ncbi:hypothetical protein H5410_026827 [Solanum commersonii]|uniref:PPM-type phosphatase domain-containing protein n=1 Tax=Solanum commersonii TaxID=4109 RepID=A0A9J5Z077_SOLCO|nr:hypothetical protein H5410_026827 [Solanum commersonii]
MTCRTLATRQDVSLDPTSHKPSLARIKHSSSTFLFTKLEITFVKRKINDECFILASDGLWDVVSSETTCWMARVCLQGDAIFYPQSELAITLRTRISMGWNSHDIISILGVDLMRNWEVDTFNYLLQTRYNYLKSYVTSKPEITFVKNNVDDECLILMSDGLWDVV